MLVGAVHGYRGLIRELMAELKRELKAQRLPVVATGGYAELDRLQAARKSRPWAAADAGRVAPGVAGAYGIADRRLPNCVFLTCSKLEHSKLRGHESHC